MNHAELNWERDGAIVLRGVFDATGMEDLLWGHLTRRYRMVRDDPASWKPGTFGKTTKFGKSGPFEGVGTPAVRDAVTALLGSAWHESDRWGAPLITFPTEGPWAIPTANWHIDMPPVDPLVAVRSFAFISPVRPAGGGTVIVAGSHLLAGQHPGISSAHLRSELAARSSWFHELWRGEPGYERTERTDRFMSGDEVDGVQVRVVELVGEPGDVVLWHPSLLHSIAPNCLDRPRFMLTHTYSARRPRHTGTVP